LDITTLVEGVSDTNDERAYSLLARMVVELKHQLTHQVDLAAFPSEPYRIYVRGVWQQVNTFIQYFQLDVPPIETSN
jgi:hypothetical protein